LTHNGNKKKGPRKSSKAGAKGAANRTGDEPISSISAYGELSDDDLLAKEVEELDMKDESITMELDSSHLDLDEVEHDSFQFDLNEDKHSDQATDTKEKTEAPAAESSDMYATSSLEKQYADQGIWEDVASVLIEKLQFKNTDDQTEILRELCRIYEEHPRDYEKSKAAYCRILEGSPLDEHASSRLIDITTQ